MDKALVIVESPAKAKTIGKYLDDYYIVKSSIGHIRDLPNPNLTKKKNINNAIRLKTINEIKEDERIALAENMGINPWCNWEVHYEIIPSKKKIVSELKQLAKKVNHIYLATDLDREGEAIAWHLQEVIGGDNKRYSRIIFNEITKNAVLQALEKPGQLNIDRVNAQQARRFIDRIVGYMISPLLWRKIARGLSAGRVQSIAVRLVVEREREIKSFVPCEYWKIHANVKTDAGEAILLQVAQRNDKPFQPKNREQALTAVSLLKKACYRVFKREEKLISTKPNAPFITATLQQAANNYLGFSVKRTMLIAQKLYEAGYITYIRTDWTNLSQDSINMVHSYIKMHFGEKYLSKNTNLYINKISSQEAHEAIRPTDIAIIHKDLKDMEEDAKKLYNLIWRQFVSCQMAPAQYESIILTVTADNFCLKAHGRVLRFDGWTRIITEFNKSNKEENNGLSKIHVNDNLSLIDLFFTQHFTKPLPRFSEASLVKELEKRGIGRPSTYASIISTIQDRGYVRIENRRFYAEKIGEIVIDCLKKSFRKLMSYNFTAQMENSLDQIENHTVEWKTVLDNFFTDFVAQLKQAEKEPKEGGMQLNYMILTNINCPTCRRKMQIRISAAGIFLGCSGYFLPPKERCKTTINLVPDNNKPQEKDNTKANAFQIKRYCKKCSADMDAYLVDSKCKLYICANNPTCDSYEIEKGEFFFKSDCLQFVNCENCGSEMQLKTGRFGKYFACKGGNCNNTRKVLRSGKLAPPKEKPVHLLELPCEKSNTYFVLRNGASGIFLAASTFPKSRETRAPFVEELFRFRDHLPERLHYLADAPQKDPQGNKTIVCFDRKMKQQYITARKRGKAMNWSVFFVDGKWIERKN